MWKTLVLATALLPAAARGAGLGSPDGSYTVEYTGYSHGFIVLKLAGTIALLQNGYTAHVSFHTAGMAAWMVRVENDSQVHGTFQGSQAVPVLFEGSGNLRGSKRVTRISYQDGNPVIQTLTPPVERERSAVPPEQTRHTIDTLSAVAMLIHDVAQTGACEGGATTFDGRRLSTQTVHTTGQEMLPQTGRSVFHGQALRCDFDGRQLGGFVNDENEDALRKPKHGTAWLAAVLPGAPPVPVRVAFDNKLLGPVTLYLTSAKAE